MNTFIIFCYSMFVLYLVNLCKLFYLYVGKPMAREKGKTHYSSVFVSCKCLNERLPYISKTFFNLNICVILCRMWDQILRISLNECSASCQDLRLNVGTFVSTMLLITSGTCGCSVPVSLYAYVSLSALHYCLSNGNQFLPSFTRYFSYYRLAIF